MKNHHTKTSLLLYNTKNRYRNNIESLIFFPFPIHQWVLPPPSPKQDGGVKEEKRPRFVSFKGGCNFVCECIFSKCVGFIPSLVKNINGFANVSCF